jgi:hypothetical protein
MARHPPARATPGGPMTVRYVSTPPKEILFSDELNLRPADVEKIAEIFETPLTGAYAWDYVSANQKIQRLYRLGKELNWNADTAVDWSYTFPRSEDPGHPDFNPFKGVEYFEKLSNEKKMDFAWHIQSWMLSQFLHGEQGALLVASQLVSCAPTMDAKYYAASQTFDEARHVEVFSRYLNEKVRFMYPINKHLKMLLDKVLTDPRWDLKFIGMQIVIEGLALAAFNTQKMITSDPLLRQILEYVIRDEARHVAFGVTYMEEFVKSLPQNEIEDRAMFAYEACVVMRERLVATDVFEHFGWDVEEARKQVLSASVMASFQNLLFTRIIPNLKKVGLITDTVRPLYEKLGILEFENLVHDGDIDWAALAEPVPETV